MTITRQILIEDLQKELARFGVSMKATDLDVILKAGADTYLSRCGVDVPEKQMTQVHIILQELRQTI